MPVVRLRAKIDTSVIAASTRSTSSVPTTATSPTPSGRDAAMGLRNTKSNRTNRIGIAIISARTRSSSTWSVTWR